MKKSMEMSLSKAVEIIKQDIKNGKKPSLIVSPEALWVALKQEKKFVRIWNPWGYIGLILILGGLVAILKGPLLGVLIGILLIWIGVKYQAFVIKSRRNFKQLKSDTEEILSFYRICVSCGKPIGRDIESCENCQRIAIEQTEAGK